MQEEYKDRIQADIDDRSDQHRKHRRFRRSLPADKCIKAQSRLHEKSSRQIDSYVALRIADGGPARTESIEDRSLKNGEEHSKNYRKPKKEPCRIPQDPLRFLIVLFSQLNRCQRRSSHPGKRAERRHQHDNRKRYPNSCERDISLPGDMADINPIYNIIQDIDKLRRHRRKRHRCHKPPKRRVSQPFILFLCLRHIISLHNLPSFSLHTIYRHSMPRLFSVHSGLYGKV